MMVFMWISFTQRDHLYRGRILSELSGILLFIHLFSKFIGQIATYEIDKKKYGLHSFFKYIKWIN